jgi:hypothetical protein
VTRPPDWEAILAYVGGGATTLFKAKSTESFTEFWTCVKISFSVFRVQTFFVYSLARSFRALCRLQISVQAWVLLTIGSLVEHTNSMKTVTDLFTVSRIDLMAVSSGSVGLPGRPLIYLLSPNSSTAYQ